MVMCDVSCMLIVLIVSDVMIVMIVSGVMKVSVTSVITKKWGGSDTRIATVMPAMPVV